MRLSEHIAACQAMLAKVGDLRVVVDDASYGPHTPRILVANVWDDGPGVPPCTVAVRKVIIEVDLP